MDSNMNGRGGDEPCSSGSLWRWVEPLLPAKPLPKPRMVPDLGGMPASAFWLWPDWQAPEGSDNLRDPGSEPFWTRPPAYPMKFDGFE